MRRRLLFLMSLVALIVASTAAATGSFAGKPAPPAAGLYPDLRAVVPQQVQLVNQQQHEWLRFSNGIANTGAGPWALRPEPPPESAVDVVSAVQEIRDSGALYRCGLQPKQVSECHNIVSETVTGTFLFHPTHNHWHLGAVALFEVRKGSPTGPVVGGLSNKTSFCLIDLYKLDGNSPTSEKVFWDCYTSYQGVSSRLGRPIPPGDRRPGARHHGHPERDGLLPGHHVEPRRELPRVEQDEQQRLGEVHPGRGQQRQPQDHPDRALTVRQPRIVRRGQRQPLTSPTQLAR